uniref:Secreted protein n=2 Tax=Schistosoma mansoni TaxID=6183 RepID=A0A5K4F608_SCHMA
MQFLTLIIVVLVVSFECQNPVVAGPSQDELLLTGLGAGIELASAQSGDVAGAPSKKSDQQSESLCSSLNNGHRKNAPPMM